MSSDDYNDLVLIVLVLFDYMIFKLGHECCQRLRSALFHLSLLPVFVQFVCLVPETCEEFLPLGRWQTGEIKRLNLEEDLFLSIYGNFDDRRTQQFKEFD